MYVEFQGPPRWTATSIASHVLRRENRCEVCRWNLVFADFHVFSNKVGKLVISAAILNI